MKVKTTILLLILSAITVGCNQTNAGIKYNIKGQVKYIKETSYTTKELVGELFADQLLQSREVFLDKNQEKTRERSVYAPETGLGTYENTLVTSGKKSEKWEIRFNDEVAYYKTVTYGKFSSTSVNETPEGVVTQRSAATYDKNWNRIEETIEKEGAGQDILTITYDSNGNEMEIKQIMPQTDTYILTVYTYEKFDSRNNWTRRINTTTFGDQEPYSDITIREIQYY